MRIAVLGAGAMGSLFGGLLADAGTDVVLIDHDGAHVEVVNTRGLRIVDDAGFERTVDIPATTDPADVDEVDLVLLFVKSYATEQAVIDSEPLVGPDTRVATLQNGLGNAETILEYVPPRRVLVGVTTHGAVRSAPGVVRHTGRGDTTLGRWNGEPDEFTRRLAATLTNANLPVELTSTPETSLWEKVLVNVGINAPTALARVDNGAVARTDPGRALLREAIGEAEAVARACGHDVREDIVAYAERVAERTAANRSSMRVDLERGGSSEVEALYGAVVDRGERVGVDTPVVRTLANLVRLAEHHSRGPNSSDR